MKSRSRSSRYTGLPDSTKCTWTDTERTSCPGRSVSTTVTSRADSPMPAGGATALSRNRTLDPGISNVLLPRLVIRALLSRVSREILGQRHDGTALLRYGLWCFGQL